MTRTNIDIMLPIDVEQGEAGLFYVTSPLIRGLLVTGQSENEALDAVQPALDALAQASGLLAAEMLAALTRLMRQPTMNPLSMTTEQRMELWAAHAEARAAIAKAEGKTE